MQSQASYRSASSSPSARRPSSGFHVDNEEADARENVVVADGHVNVRASAAMTDDNGDDADDGNFPAMTLSAKSSALHSGSHLLSTDLAFGAVDSNVDLACTHLRVSASEVDVQARSTLESTAPKVRSVERRCDPE
jgi:hypothetical protein